MGFIKSTVFGLALVTIGGAFAEGKSDDGGKGICRSFKGTREKVWNSLISAFEKYPIHSANQFHGHLRTEEQRFGKNGEALDSGTALGPREKGEVASYSEMNAFLASENNQIRVCIVRSHSILQAGTTPDSYSYTPTSSDGNRENAILNTMTTFLKTR